MSRGYFPGQPRAEMLSDLRRDLTGLALPGLIGVGVLLALVGDVSHWPVAMGVSAVAFICTQFAAWALLARAQRLARAMIVASCLALGIASTIALRSGAPLCLLALPVGLAVFVGGIAAGAVAAALSSLVVSAAAHGLAGLDSSSFTAAQLAIWGMAILSIAYAWLTGRLINGLSADYAAMHRETLDARNQRLELKQVQEDLVRANAELARLSDRLQHMYQVAEEARRAKAEFVANVSHELRTPLNMVIGFCEMITHAPDYYGGLPPKLLADIRAIQRNAQHLGSLIDDVLDISQVEANRMALSREPASLADVIASAMQSVQGFFQSKGLSLDTEIPVDLPAVACDPLRIRQVLLNLLSNAGRFTERGGVHIRVAREEHRLIVSVSDTGPGIPEEAQGKLFQPFQQADGSLRRRQGGSGLGLAIGKRFVELHGGEIWLQSTVGVGTTVSFSLPLGAETSATLAQDAITRWFSPYHQFEVRTRHSRTPLPEPLPRFVVLEKGHALQRLLRRYMDSAELVPVSDMADALRELSHSPAQALLVNAPWPREMSMPSEWSGPVPYDTPVIACWVPGEEEVARQLGVVSYLVKPVTRDALLSSLETLGGGIHTVLLVDDEPEALQLYGRMLSSARRDYRVLRATSGREAMAMLRRWRPDAVVLDLMMPDMDGFELLRQKGQDPGLQAIPAVVVSAREIAGEHLISNTLVAYRSGLTVEDLTRCIRLLSESLSPAPRPRHPAQSETRAG